MQDEVNEKTMALCIKGGKISAQILKAALTKLLAEIEKKKQQSKKMGGQNRCKRGKQSMQNFMRTYQKDFSRRNVFKCLQIATTQNRLD